MQIEKDYIDNYCESDGKATIPTCEVILHQKDQQGANMQPMKFRVNLRGAKPPRNFFTVSAPPHSPQRNDQGEKICTFLHGDCI